MRGYRWAVLLLALLCVGLLTGATLAILDTADQVSVEREVLAGDPDAAAGVELTLPLTCEDQLFWVTTFPAARPEEASTVFESTLSEDYRTAPLERQPLSVEIAEVYYWGETPDTPYTLYDSFRQQARESVPVGTEATVSFRLRDYFDTWPLRVTGDSPDIGYNLSENLSLRKLFQDYFAFPVPDDAIFTLTVHSSSGYSYSSGFIPRVESHSAACGDAILFVLSSTATISDEYGRSVSAPLDGSAIPGGWGLYRYTFADDGGAGTLETLWSLPEEASILDFWGTEDETDFFLLTREEGQLRLRVFDGDGNLRQSLDLLSFSDEESYMQTYKGEDFFVPMVYGPREENYCYRFPVVCRQPEGWALAFTGDDREAAQLDHGGFSWADDQYAGLSMAFDGERLAVRDGCRRDNSPFHLAIYSRDGLDYLATYQNSVAQAADDSNIGPLYYDMARLFWLGTPIIRWTESAS